MVELTYESWCEKVDLGSDGIMARSMWAAWEDHRAKYGKYAGDAFTFLEGMSAGWNLCRAIGS